MRTVWNYLRFKLYSKGDNLHVVDEIVLKFVIRRQLLLLTLTWYKCIRARTYKSLANQSYAHKSFISQSELLAIKRFNTQIVLTSSRDRTSHLNEMLFTEAGWFYA